MQAVLGALVHLMPTLPHSHLPVGYCYPSLQGPISSHKWTHTDGLIAVNSPQPPPGWLERPPRRIAVLRANGLGDFLEATPALRALGRAFPEAEVTYLCRPWMAAFLGGRYPYLHRVIPIPYYPVLDDPPAGQAVDEVAVAEFFQAMRAERLDLAIQMQGEAGSPTHSCQGSAPGTRWGSRAGVCSLWRPTSVTSTTRARCYATSSSSRSSESRGMASRMASRWTSRCCPPTRQVFRPVLSWTLDCPACGKRIMDPSYPSPSWCECQVSFVQDAPLDEVLDHVEDLLGAHIPIPDVR